MLPMPLLEGGATESVRGSEEEANVDVVVSL